MADESAKPRRPGTVFGDRNEGRKSRPLGVPVVYVCDDETGKYEAGDITHDELVEKRSERPHDARLTRLEEKHDNLVSVVGELRQTVGEVSGKLDILPQLVTAVKDASDRVQQREHVTFTAQVEVDKATKLDVIDAHKQRRQLALKVIGLLGAGGVVAEVAHWLIGKAS